MTTIGLQLWFFVGSQSLYPLYLLCRTPAQKDTVAIGASTLSAIKNDNSLIASM